MKKLHSQGITWEHVRNSAERAGLHFRGPQDWHPVEAFAFLAKQGIAPPPELLIAVGEAFASYFEAEGKLDLEQAMFGRRVQNVGNYSARRANEGKRDLQGLAITLVAQAAGLSLAKAAERVAEASGITDDTGTLVRRSARVRAKRKAK